MTYGEVAKAAGHPGAARQVVWALQGAEGKMPWHRVVGAGLKILLPGEGGLEQIQRLESEGWVVRGTRLQKRSEEKLGSKLKTTGTARGKNRSKRG